MHRYPLLPFPVVQLTVPYPEPVERTGTRTPLARSSTQTWPAHGRWYRPRRPVTGRRTGRTRGSPSRTTQPPTDLLGLPRRRTALGEEPAERFTTAGPSPLPCRPLEQVDVGNVARRHEQPHHGNMHGATVPTGWDVGGDTAIPSFIPR